MDFEQVEQEFEEQWYAGIVQGWENLGQENGHFLDQPVGIDLDYYGNVEELMIVGPEKLKEVEIDLVIFIAITSYSRNHMTCVPGN